MDKSKAQIQSMFSEIASFYDRGNSVLSMGLHFLWKKELVNKVCKENPSVVLDLCAGTGDIYFGLLEKSINAVAIDFTLPMLQVLADRQEKSFSGLPHKIAAADALNLPLKDNSFDAVTVSYGVRNFESLEKGLKEALRILKPDGKLFILEFGKAPENLMGKLVRFYEAKVVPLLGRLVFSSPKAYAYLSDSAEAFPGGKDFLDIARKAGFRNAEFKALWFGASYLYSMQK